MTRSALLIAALTGCTGLAGLDDLAFGSSSSAAGGTLGPGGVGGAGASGGGSVGGGGTSSASVGSGGGAPCGVSGPYDIVTGVGDDPNTAPFIAALGWRWGISWTRSNQQYFVSVDKDGESIPDLPAQIPMSRLGGITASDNYFYLAGDGPAPSSRSIYRVDAAAEVRAEMPVPHSAHIDQIRPIYGSGGVYVVYSSGTGAENVHVAILNDDADAVPAGEAIVGSSGVACCSSRPWRALPYSDGVAVALDTSPQDVLALRGSSDWDLVPQTGDIPLSGGTVLGEELYFSDADEIWRCSPMTGACSSKAWEDATLGSITRGDALWATGREGTAMKITRYDYDDGPSSPTYTVDHGAAQPIQRAVYAHNGDAFGLAWLQDGTMRFAVVKDCP